MILIIVVSLLLLGCTQTVESDQNVPITDDIDSRIESDSNDFPSLDEADDGNSSGFRPLKVTDDEIEKEEASFFITSTGLGDGANLGGLIGADAHCKNLASAFGGSDKEWRAYLSSSDTDARDRIGSGPWHNVKGELIASDVNELHAKNNLDKLTVLNEHAMMVNGRGDTPNRHDILTGSDLNGTRFSKGDTTCSDWTSNDAGSARVGHHDRTGGGDYPESWNSAHGSRGCSQEDLQGTGGDGLFYCFSI